MAGLVHAADGASATKEAMAAASAGTPGCDCAPAGIRERLAGCVTGLVECHPGRNSCVARDGETGLFQVVEGVLADCWQTPGGSERIVAFLYPGDWILPSLSAAPWRAVIRPLGEARLQRLDGQRLRKACRGDPDLGYELFGIACRELTRRTAQAVLLRGASVDARFAAFLIDLAHHLGAAEGNELVVPVPMTRNDIANHLGLRTETLCRIIGRWRRRGLIALEGPRQIHIPDLAEIALIAEDREAA